ncbi:MAG: hypothetical protein P8X49_14575, partial [Syntrophobacterales bacterium]
ALWWGLSLGIVLCLLALAGLYLAGYRVMHHAAAPAPPAERKPLCYVSPTDYGYINHLSSKNCRDDPHIDTGQKPNLGRCMCILQFLMK